MKKIKEDTDKWNDTLCPWIGRFNIVKMSILPKSISKFIVQCYQNSNDIFIELALTILKLIWDHKRPEIAKSTSSCHTSWFKNVF